MEKKPFIPKEGKGRIFPNRRKENNNHPDYRGDAMVNSVHVEIAGWNQEDGSISLSIHKKQDRPQKQRSPAPDRDTSDVPLKHHSSPVPGLTPSVEDDVPFAVALREFNWGRLA